MKRFALLLTICLTIFECLLAQSKPQAVALREDKETPKISISEMKWEKGLLPPASNEYKPKPVLPDVTQPNDDFRKTPVLTMPQRGLQAAYWYEALFKNDGNKKINGIVWDYIFFDLENKQELGRHVFFNLKQIGANKSVVIRNRIFTPPSNIVTYGSLEKDKRSPYLEKSEIRCILYSDNSLWRRADVSPEYCKIYKLRGGFGWERPLKN